MSADFWLRVYELTLVNKLPNWFMCLLFSSSVEDIASFVTMFIIITPFKFL